MVGDRNVGQPAGFRGSDHRVERVLAVRLRGVHVQITREVGQRDQRGQGPFLCGVDLTPVLAKFRLDEVEAQRLVDPGLAGTRNGAVRLVEEPVFVQLPAAFECAVAQGDGELCGVAIEHPTTTTVQVDVIKNWTISNPRLENSKLFMSIGSGRPMEDAVRRAYRDLIRWMSADWGWDELEAYFLLTQCGRVPLGNMVDPKYTLGASISKDIINKK